MTIAIRCNCGQTLQVPETAIGKRVRCANCQAVLSVPGLSSRPVESVAAFSSRPSPDRNLSAGPQRSIPQRRPSGSSKMWLFVLLGVAAVLLLGCITVGGAAAYFLVSSGRSSAEAQLIGDWEMDPEPWQKVADKAPVGGMFMPDVKLSFNKDHTFKLVLLVEMEGRWQVVSRSGNQLQVKMTMQTFGMDQSYPPTATITIVDKDHIDFAANEKSMQLAGRFRRVGTGPPIKTNGGGSNSPGPAVAKPPAGNPALDAGMKPDCEVEWNGTWYPAKILKTEKDRWFIHYVGWQSHWDEWVDEKRIRFKK